MSLSDPFADSGSKPRPPDRTLIIPAPGGRKRNSAARPPSPGTRPAQPPEPLDSNIRNPLIRSAGTLFALARKLKNTPTHKNVPRLRLNVLKMLNAFNQEALKRGSDKQAVHFACYALCALIDEIVLETPWGNQSNWDHESLLGTLFNDARGGEKFFQILERAGGQPAENIDLLEFLYLCLGLGFQGKFAITPGGQENLAGISRDLYRTLCNHSGGPDRFLSPQGHANTARPRGDRFVPIWVVPVAALGVAALMFYFFNASINQSSREVEARLNGIARNALPAPQAGVEETSAFQELLNLPPQTEPTWLERLRDHFQSELRRGWVDIQKTGVGIKITLYNLGLFQPGSAHVSEIFHPILSKLGNALNEIPGYIVVTGHTDNQPISTLKFPSNWRLSLERAQSVTHILAAATGSRDKFKPEGRADYEPIVPNDTPEGRQRNRRVEIFVPRAP